MTCNVKCRSNDPMGTLALLVVAVSSMLNNRCTAYKVCMGIISNISCRKG